MNTINSKDESLVINLPSSHIRDKLLYFTTINSSEDTGTIDQTLKVCSDILTLFRTWVKTTIANLTEQASKIEPLTVTVISKAEKKLSKVKKQLLTYLEAVSTENYTLTSIIGKMNNRLMSLEIIKDRIKMVERDMSASGAILLNKDTNKYISEVNKIKALSIKINSTVNNFLEFRKQFEAGVIQFPFEKSNDLEPLWKEQFVTLKLDKDDASIVPPEKYAKLIANERKEVMNRLSNVKQIPIRAGTGQHLNTNSRSGGFGWPNNNNNNNSLSQTSPFDSNGNDIDVTFPSSTNAETSVEDVVIGLKLTSDPEKSTTMDLDDLEHEKKN